MISYQDLQKLRRGNRVLRNAQVDLIQQARQGIEVIVLVKARYNGTDHRVIGDAESMPGDIITIASDSYDFLEEQGMIISVAKAEKLRPEAQTGDGKKSDSNKESTDADKTDEDAGDTEGWKIFIEAGLTETQAQTVFFAGITSKDMVLDVGEETIAALPKVSKAKATALIEWASK